MKIYNYAAGPAKLPDQVISQIQEELPSVQGSGMSILEISHRSALFENILADAQQDLRDLMKIPDNYHILFFQGGGTGQFAAAPLNLATNHRKIALLDSGHWAVRAGDEATRLGFDMDTLASTKNIQYQSLPHLPENQNLDQYDYLHLTMNNTIEGTAYHQPVRPINTELVADMSSNFLAETYNVTDFGLIFAGAQKNLGPAGVTVVIVRDDLVHKVENVPSILDYDLFVKKNSLYNTPPVFPIYTAGLVLKWLKEIGGIDEMQKINEQKSQMLYDFLDQSKLFTNHITPSDRSLTNIPFTTGDEQLDNQVINAATEHGLMSLKGHRSVGGLRASLYNAMPIEGAQVLVDFLEDFEKHYQGGH
ncbi:3-phosphoserine/phosphohydroxythreonine transaminase [Lentilactobacillus sp. SPB1-3]|uniref:3-phosphoserine/phosphohydroxythreonine transaminase n=1 Tax=Lentilactobacillus terminaliae TaxID=3003483 RepID=A0ACD5DFN5_9LACO|nr:3-phosphoserine/phosphohydroxythreonine transaminase [Lentilactobacillus sp. SPB1-3]MCZ0976375.1 3-phosphoserine/phosphohydroxythreonine transaminase [Lentilactobacillus sp. SPB1-3]